MIAAAPGTPLPRFRPGWDEDGALVLVPAVRALEREETCPECSHRGGLHDSLLGCTVELEPARSCPCRRLGCGCG